MSELKVGSVSLTTSSIGSAPMTDLDGGDLSPSSVILDGGKINETADITLSGGKMSMQAKEIRGEPFTLGIVNLALRKPNDGKSAYEYAKENGYLGTEAEFGYLLAHIQEAECIDNLVSHEVNKPLSANQGRVLNEKIDSVVRRDWIDLDNN